jgi:hypothetical protein
MNPYLPPQSSGEAPPRVKPFARFEKLNLAATLAGALCAILVYAETRSLLLGAAVVCASLLLCLLQSSIISYITAALAWRDEMSATMDHRKVVFDQPRKTRRNGGGVVIDCLGMVLCSYALLAVLWLFATGVFAL